MSTYTLSFKPTFDLFGKHDPSAAIFKDGDLVFAVEEERYTRTKHAIDTFPENAIQACLDYCDIILSDVDEIILPYEPSLQNKQFVQELKKRTFSSSKGLPERLRWTERFVEQSVQAQFLPNRKVKNKLKEIGTPVPPITNRSHHACHAASAFHPAGFEEALTLTIDGKGEYDSTVVWRGNKDGLHRVKTYEYPNSLGHFYGVVTAYLGYHAFNGEGKVMGLAPYGDLNPEIERALRRIITTGVDYDVTPVTANGIEAGVERLEKLLGRKRNDTPGEFNQWQKDLARVTQHLLEETVLEIVQNYLSQMNLDNVCLSGGVALNCKMNRRIRELDAVENIFIQPVAHDAGLAVGAGYIDQKPSDVKSFTNVYWGPSCSTSEIKSLLNKNKINYKKPDNLEQFVAKRLSDGGLVGWFQGRLELGPRALGNRSILADPRTEESRDRVNKYVKHREEWRPFAPSMLEEAADKYLKNVTASPFMIDTFETVPEKRDEIAAVLHPADQTTRVQTVSEDINPRYYKLISEFESITGVPAVLNTSFNDHAEPIVTTPSEALKDFFAMGLDLLVLEDFIIEK